MPQWPQSAVRCRWVFASYYSFNSFILKTAKCCMKACIDEWSNDVVGDAYRYTLTPVFASLTDSFRCYLRRRPPNVMYRVSLYVTLPGLEGLESRTLEEQVLTRSSTKNIELQRDRQTLFTMLTVEHNVGGPPIDDELLLTARQSVETTQNASNVDAKTGMTMNYSIQPAYNGQSTYTNRTELIVRYSPGVASLTLVITIMLIIL